MADPDDIIRDIDETDLQACAAEVERLKKKKRGYKAAFTQILNVIDRLIQSAKGADNKIDRSEGTIVAPGLYGITTLSKMPFFIY